MLGTVPVQKIIPCMQRTAPQGVARYSPGLPTTDGDWPLFVDESHVTVPQLSMMHSATYSRKQKLIQHSYWMSSAMENIFDEFWRSVPQAVFISATPSAFELANGTIEVVLDDGSDLKADDDDVEEAVIRPTGVLDPVVETVPGGGQMDHLVPQLARNVARGERALITTLTKKGVEDLADNLNAQPSVEGPLERRLAVTFTSWGRLYGVEGDFGRD
jgi:excinuclease UvrABC helicase subunit UvrB